MWRILRLIDTIDPWVEATSGATEPTGIWTPQHRSPLATDDRRTHPYRLSHRAWIALSVAVDFLHCYKRSLVQDLTKNKVDVRLHSYAQMGLLRGAVENASTALWLLAPPREERITNRLRLEWKELGTSYQLRELLGAPPPRPIEERKRQLIDLLLAARLPSTMPANATAEEQVKAATKALHLSGYAVIVAEAGHHVTDVGSKLAELTWRMCSSLAHGDQSATIGLLGSEVVGQVEPGINLMRVSAPVRLLLVATTVAYLLLKHGFETLQRRTQPPY